jgi:hypothetical protein
MSEVELLEQKVRNLSAEQLAEFRAWFLEYDWQIWDQQIELDTRAGKLNKLIAEAQADFQADKAHGKRALSDEQQAALDRLRKRMRQGHSLGGKRFDRNVTHER